MTIDYNALTPEELLNMSDEDFRKLDPSKIPTTAPVVEEAPVEETQPEVQPEVIPEVEPEPEPQVEQPSEGVPNGEPSEAQDIHAGTEPNVGSETQPEPTQETKPEPQVEVTPEKAFFDKVTGGFTANGKEYKIDNADDVVKLMQMGLNYNQKMAAMKPGLKVLKALQDHGIESVDQLGYLLDLHNKKPEAIAKLVQEAGIDTYDLNEEKAAAYQPSRPEVSDATINFELAAKALEGNPHFGTVVQQLGTYDEQTKQEIFNNPGLLSVLTSHVEKGQYDQIVARVQYEQSLGRLTGMSFLQAYDTVGNLLFGQVQQPQVQPQVQPVVNQAPVVPTPVPVPVATKPNTSNNAARNLATAPHSTAAQVNKQVLTPEQIWNMSPEEFAKLDPKLL